MKKLVVLSLALIFILGSGLMAQDKPKEEKKEVKVEKTSDGKPVNTICPVSTEEADPQITHTVDGKTYAVCCEKCLKKFKENPEKYISRLSEDGKSIKKKKAN